MNRRRLALLVIIIALLVFALLSIAYFLSSLLEPPGTKTIESETANGVTMTWERSVYGMGAAEDQALDDPVDTAAAGGLIYVAQPTRAAVWVFNDDGAPVRVITNEQFKLPNAVEAGPAGRLFVADKGRDLVFCVDEDGVVQWMKQAIRVSDMTWAEDRLYVAAYDRIQVLDINGDELYQWGERGYSQGQLDFPHGILVRDEEIIVSDSNNARLQAFDHDGKFLWETSLSYRDPESTDTSATALFQVPGGLCSGPEGQILVTDAFGFDIVALDSDANLIARLGSEGSADGRFWYPSSIVALGDDRYVVADTVNDRLQIVRITFDGTGSPAGLPGPISGLSGIWCMCPGALLLLLLVAGIAWVMSGRRERSAEESVSPLEEPVDQADNSIK